MTDTRQVLSDLMERWPGYNEQSWAQRFAELDRQFSKERDTAVKAICQLSEQQSARIQALETSLATVQRAAKTIMINEADELRQLRDERVKWHQAIATLDSERQANALLTDRVEALETSLAEARRQALEEAAKACEAERLSEPQDDSDAAYDSAIDHCAQAIRAIASDPLLDRQGKEGV